MLTITHTTRDGASLAVQISDELTTGERAVLSLLLDRLGLVRAPAATAEGGEVQNRPTVAPRTAPKITPRQPSTPRPQASAKHVCQVEGCDKPAKKFSCGKYAKTCGPEHSRLLKEQNREKKRQSNGVETGPSPEATVSTA